MKNNKKLCICYDCTNRHDIVGSCHSGCYNFRAKVNGDEYGIKKGWFMWPFNFDPIWLDECDGFEEIKKKINE